MCKLLEPNSDSFSSYFKDVYTDVYKMFVPDDLYCDNVNIT